jgi:preprotein translocase subunit SecG
MQDFIIVIDILSAVGLVALVLLQQGKGADIGAAFGSGASQTLFGARGSANFLTRTTAILATVFFVANMTLAYLATQQTAPKSVTRSVTTQEPAPKPEEKKGAAVPPAPAVPDVPEVPR